MATRTITIGPGSQRQYAGWGLCEQHVEPVMAGGLALEVGLPPEDSVLVRISRLRE